MESSSDNNNLELVKTAVNFLIIFNTIIPISIIITSEVVKGIQVYLLSRDKDLQKEKGDNLKILSLKLQEDLGCLKYIFTDKTGTLTKNEMLFRSCSIFTNLYDKESELIKNNDAEKDNNDISKNFKNSKSNENCSEIKESELKSFKSNNSSNNNENKNKISKSAFAENFDVEDLKKSLYDSTKICFSESPYETVSEVNTDFLISMAINHNVLLDKNNDEVEYQGPSPDECVFVKSAAELGVEFLERNSSSVKINFMQSVIEFEVLYKFEYTSQRMRSSIIIKNSSGIIKLYIKGSDNIMMKKLDKFSNLNLLEKSTSDLDYFAKNGLRTLCFGIKTLDENEFKNWEKKYLDLQYKVKMDNSLYEDLEICINEIEDQITLLGITALEDKLQEDVPECLNAFIEAGIEVFMLTGDKMDTAETIGFSSQLFKEDTEVFKIKNENDPEIINKNIKNIMIKMDKIEKELTSNESTKSNKFKKKKTFTYRNKRNSFVEKKENEIVNKNMRSRLQSDKNLFDLSKRSKLNIFKDNKKNENINGDFDVNSYCKNNSIQKFKNKDMEDPFEERRKKKFNFFTEIDISNDSNINNYSKENIQDYNDLSILRDLINEGIIDNKKDHIIDNDDNISIFKKIKPNFEENDNENQIENYKRGAGPKQKKILKQITENENDEGKNVPFLDINKNKSSLDMKKYINQYKNRIENMEQKKETFLGFKVDKQNDDYHEKEFKITNFGLIVEGNSISLCLDDQNKEEFWKIINKTRAIICCRCSPIQKADIVKFVKEKSRKVTLAIGDGGNDVNMIRNADIGIGLFGKEGSQAAYNSDYAFSKFKYLKILILNHGRMFLMRNSYFVLYFFYKNLIFTFPQIWISFYCGFSGTLLWDTFYSSMYNTLITLIPVSLYMLLNQDIDIQFKNYPENINRLR